MTRIAVVNAGAATLKLAVLDVSDDGVREEQRTERSWEGDGNPGATVAAAIASLDGEVDGIGHRVVHGGAAFSDPVRVDAAVEAGIERLTPLAPLHNALALEGIRAARRARPGVANVAVFDTAFHAHRAAESMAYALPDEAVRRFGLRRYGFHGIAHRALVEALATALGRAAADVTAVTLQLGAGCSACAVDNGRSVETSMGFTPLEGLVMATRCGDIDPAIVLQMARAGCGFDEIEDLLTRQSGLKGLAGSADMREVLAAEGRGDAGAQLALRVFVRRIVLTVGAYFTLLGGRGALVFGGGIGARSAAIRSRICAGLAPWNVAIDDTRNEAGEPGRISREDSRGVFVLQASEEHLIAREVVRLLRA